MSEGPLDPSQVSYYVDDARYDELLLLAKDWQRATVVGAKERPDPETRADCDALVAAEARLSDDGRYEDWLTCYSPECIYWIPSSSPDSDPRREVTFEIHDRRRLEDRVARIRTGLAYSMIPPVPTSHVMSPVEWWWGREGEVRGRASFLIDALVKDRHRVLSGWMGYSLVQSEGRWVIAVKQVNLIDSDLPQGNNSFFL